MYCICLSLSNSHWNFSQCSNAVGKHSEYECRCRTDEKKAEAELARGN